MDAQNMEKQGTELSDILRILSEVPEERLLSLTFQFHLGKSPEEALVHTLCLMLLRRDTQAQERLQTLKDSSLANYLADKWHVSGGKLDTFRVQCAAHCEEESTGHGMVVELARVFKVLCKERLCDPLLRDLAYRRAISANVQKTWDRQHLEYSCLDQLREEAKLVCGPHVAEWMCSSNKVPGVLDKDKNASLKPSSEDTSDLPSPLQDSYSTDSYPTHLEISLASTTSAAVSDPQSSNATHLVEKDGPEAMPAGRTAFSTETQSESHQTPLIKGETYVNNMDTPGSATLSAKGNRLQCDTAPNQNQKSTVPTFEPMPAPAAANTFTPEIKVPAQAYEGEPSTEEEEEEEEEDVFYSFVILHAPQDAEMAESISERLESLSNSKGATFTDNFQVPGRGTLKCIEDAIDNSAYTFLLLTRNFTRLQEVETDTALINSINNRHKYNTVIPLHPRENCMPRDRQPKVLQTLVPLEERSRNFERKVKMVLSPAKVKAQKRLWDEEQKVRQQVRRQERLRHANEQKKLHNRELRKAKLLEQERMRLHMEQLNVERSPKQHYPHTGPQFTNGPSGFVPPQVGEDGRLWSGNIHIEHANYIMIGNDSQMTVDLGGAASREDLTDDDDKLYCPA